MKQIQCPKCKSYFQLYDEEYASIVAQIKNEEFDAEINRRLEALEERHRNEKDALKLKADKSAADLLSDKQRQLDELQLELDRMKMIVENNDMQKKQELASLTAEKEKELARLSAENQAEIARITADKEKECAQLSNQLELSEKQHELDIIRERNNVRDDLTKKEMRITELESELQSQKIRAEKELLEVNERNNVLLQAKDEEIERYRDLKSRLSTKLLGETLERHCHNMFNRARSQGQFADAYFEKDNDASSGTKGDFIFRDFLNGREYISIMFEMKNEDDKTVTKHRNEDFLAKLHKDRTEKKCEYAVLVSTLEADSELYNEGIVDVSFRYDKMFVVRPQFFLSIISTLSRAARRGAERLVEMQRDLELARAQSIDVSTFESRLDQFRGVFMKYTEAHRKKQDDAITNIDKVIETLEKQAEALRKVKSLFETSGQKLVRANETLENDLTIKKLTRGNPTMKALFDEARKTRE